MRFRPVTSFVIPELYPKMLRQPLLLALGLTLCAPALSAITDLWVAPGAMEGGDGSPERPFSKLEEAKMALRNIVAMGMTDDVTIRLGGGVHRLPETLELTTDELGDGSHAVTIMGNPGEQAILVGSRRLPDTWRQVDGNLWRLEIPEAEQKGWVFRSLFRSGKSLLRAREPDQGYFTVAHVSEERRRLELRETVPDEWSGLENVELNTTAHWHFNRQPIESISGNHILARRGIGTDVSGSRITAESHSRVWLVNALPFVDEAGEWFLDTESGVLYLKMGEGETPHEYSFSAPHLRELIVVRGSAENQVAHVSFRNLEFAETDWEMPEEGRLGIQAGAWAFDHSRTFSPSAALRLIYAQNIAVQHCSFRDLGDGAISFEVGTSDCSVRFSSFLRVGSNAVQVGRMPAYTGQGHPLHRDFADPRTRVDESGTIPTVEQMRDRSRKLTPEAPARIVISDNTFVDCGHLDYGSVAVCITYARHIAIDHNLFRNLPYSAISVGWRWAPGLSNTHSNLIRRNFIEGVMRQAGDGAGIYLVGEQPGTRVIENHVTDSGRNYWSHGIYPDECSDHMEIFGNYVTDVMDHSIFMNKNGPSQIVRDNNGESGPTLVTGRNTHGGEWVDFSPERMPPDLSLYGPRPSEEE